MAKRFIDTDMWSKKWIRLLDPKLKLFWVYLLSRCNHAGIYEVDLELASFQLKLELDEKEILNSFNGIIKPIDNDKWFIPKFIEFQYGPLNEKVNAHRSVINILKKYKLLNKNQQLINSSSTVQDKDKDKDIDKDKDKREQKFTNKVCAEGVKITPMVDPKIINEFCDYWTESNMSGTKMKFEMQKTFDINRRLKKWIQNSKDWNLTPKSDLSDFKLDSTGYNYIGYCDKCNVSGFYKKEQLNGDSSCCSAKIKPTKEKK